MSEHREERGAEQTAPLPLPLPTYLFSSEPVEPPVWPALQRGGDRSIEHEFEMLHELKYIFNNENLQIYTKVDYNEFPCTHHPVSTMINNLPILFHLSFSNFYFIKLFMGTF